MQYDIMSINKKERQRQHMINNTPIKTSDFVLILY